MRKRIVTKIGDVFSVQIGERTNKYFQLIAYDRTQLNSDVIRAFKAFYPSDTNVDLTEVVNGEVDFYAHCVTTFGVKMGLWEKVGKSENIGSLDQILFRDTNDYGHKEGEEPVRVSNNWYVWHVNERFRDVGKLVGENLKAEIGVVVNPYDIVERMKTGEYSFYYPDYE